MTKQLKLFLVPEDEGEFSWALRKVRKGIAFVDGSVWAGPEPERAQSIQECRSRLVYLWDRDLISPLPTVRRSDGRLEGPISGVVVQFERSQLRGELLLSGSAAAGTGGMDDALELEVRDFIGDVWKVLKEVAPARLDAVNPETGTVINPAVPNFRAGRHALAWIEEQTGRYFKDRNTPNYFRPS